MSKERTRIDATYITKVAILAGMAMVLMLFEIPLWFAPGFYKLDFSEIPVLLGGFALGPVAAIFIETVKILLNLAINGTITMGIGELGNLLIGCAMAVPASIIYKKRKTFKMAFLGLGVGVLSMVVVGGLVNLYLLLPAYSAFLPIPMAAIIGMGSKLNQSIVDLKSFVFFATSPFNLFKGVAVSIPVLILYKRLSPILHKGIKQVPPKISQKNMGKIA